jgi:hypothetical protein
MSHGLLVRVHAGSGAAPHLERELAAAVAAGSPTAATFAVRFGRGDYAAFTSAADDDPVTDAVGHRIEPLLEGPVERAAVDVLAATPLRPRSAHVTKAALLTFAPRPDQTAEVEDLLAADAGLAADDEAEATASYPLRLPGGELGVFDVFPTSWARVRHLRTLVRRDLRGWGRSVVGGFPGVRLLDVVAATPGMPRDPRADRGSTAALGGQRQDAVT